MKQKPDIQNQILGELNKINLQLSSIQQTLANNTNVIEELKNKYLNANFHLHLLNIPYYCILSRDKEQNEIDLVQNSNIEKSDYSSSGFTFCYLL